MEDRVLELLKKSNALLEGHFLLSSGKHSNRYVQCAKLLMNPEMAEEVCKVIMKKMEPLLSISDGWGTGKYYPAYVINMVAGPAMGGIIISYEMGRALGVPAIFTERENNQMTLRRGFDIKKGQKILVVEDVVTTGKSTLETIKVLEDLGAKVVGVACIVDRSGGKDIGYPIYSATKLEIETFEPEECPLCREGVPAIKPGSRVKF